MKINFNGFFLPTFSVRFMDEISIWHLVRQCRWFWQFRAVSRLPFRLGWLDNRLDPRSALHGVLSDHIERVNGSWWRTSVRLDWNVSDDWWAPPPRLIKTFIHQTAAEPSWERGEPGSAPVSVFHHPARHPRFNYLSTTFWQPLTCSWRVITIRRSGVWRANLSRFRPSTLSACKLWNPNQVSILLTFVITA